MLLGHFSPFLSSKPTLHHFDSHPFRFNSSFTLELFSKIYVLIKLTPTAHIPHRFIASDFLLLERRVSQDRRQILGWRDSWAENREM